MYGLQQQLPLQTSKSRVQTNNKHAEPKFEFGMLKLLRSGNLEFNG